MDEYARRVRQLTPFAGIEQALLPGAIEWEREQRSIQEGIPISPRHAQALRKLASECGLPAPL